jgi:cholesterol oxidase
VTAEEDVFDAVVIGSGFGGAVAADRLAEREIARVLVLERGLPYPPGSFRRTPWEMRDNVWAPGSARFGLFELLKFDHVTAVVSSGLGGGSLIYANVLLRKPPATFGPDEANGWREWPIKYSDLEPGYDAVLARLNPVEMPYGAYYVPKTPAFRTALGDASHEPEPAPIAVTFAHQPGDEPQPGLPLLDANGQIDTDNLHDRPRRTCTLVGECDFGCNEGAKNTLDFNFLSEFLRFGGRRQIRTCCDVTDIARLPDGRGYEVHYRQHRVAREQVVERARTQNHRTDLKLLDHSNAERRAVEAKVVILAGGTFGSTRLLLASRGSLPRLSGQLGRGFSSNGDLLKFARDCRRSGKWRNLAPSRGPVITSYAEVDEDGLQTWLEDGGYPRGLEMMWQLTEVPQDLWSMKDVALRWLRRRLVGNVGPEFIKAVGTAHASASMLPLLAMGRDVPGGRMELDGGLLTLDWNPDRESGRYFSFVERSTRDLAAKLGGKLADRGWRRYLLPGRGLTAHPLGGCRMGRTDSEGVVSDEGEVFGCPGLFVADGSVMPGPIGPNPSLTIGALSYKIAGHAADRVAGHAADRVAGHAADRIAGHAADRIGAPGGSRPRPKPSKQKGARDDEGRA